MGLFQDKTTIFGVIFRYNLILWVNLHLHLSFYSTVTAFDSYSCAQPWDFEKIGHCSRVVIVKRVNYFKRNKIESNSYHSLENWRLYKPWLPSLSSSQDKLLAIRMIAPWNWMWQCNLNWPFFVLFDSLLIVLFYFVLQWKEI